MGSASKWQSTCLACSGLHPQHKEKELKQLEAASGRRWYSYQLLLVHFNSVASTVKVLKPWVCVILIRITHFSFGSEFVETVLLALAGPKLVLPIRLAVDSKQSSCLCLLSAEIMSICQLIQLYVTPIFQKKMALSL